MQDRRWEPSGFSIKGSAVRVCHCLGPTGPLWCNSRCLPGSVCTCAWLQRAVWLCPACLCLLLLCDVCSSPVSCMSGSEQQVFCSCLVDPGIFRAPAKTAPLLGTSHLCVSPSFALSPYPAYYVSPGNAPPPFLPPFPPSLLLLSGALSLLWLFPLSLYLPGWKSNVK